MDDGTRAFRILRTVRHALTPTVGPQLCTIGRICAELCNATTFDAAPNFDRTKPFSLYNQLVDIQRPLKSGRRQWGRAGCDWSGQRIANWANKARNRGQIGRAGCDWSGQRIANWANKARNRGQIGRAGCDWSGQRIANWANKARNRG